MSFDKRPVKTIALMMVSVALLSFSCMAQELEKTIKTYKSLPRYTAIEKFYQINGYTYCWIINKYRLQALVNLINNAEEYGLNTKDYQYSFIQSFIKNAALKNANDSTEADVYFTDAAIHFFTELHIGNRPPPLSYEGLKYIPDVSDIPALVKGFTDKDQLHELVELLQPKSTEYTAVAKKLSWFLHVINDSNYKELKIVSNKISNANKPLLLRLYQLGFIDSLNAFISDKDLAKKIKEAQGIFDVLNDGLLRSTTLQALNVPLKKRVTELVYALNYLRWLDQLKQNSFAMILNIPSASFMVYDSGKVVLDSKIVAGKSSTSTPTLSSTITEVILYPYWMVPFKIATKELLPSIKKNIAFLQLGNYQVINKQGRVLDPYSINWHAFSTSYFPYIIRQSTGCDNALGIVKFNFYNPYTVYLHDTPGKTLFSFNKRYFSHGCMRVEKPLELAHLVLGNNRIAIDTLTAKGCVNQQAPITVQVERKLPLIVMYSTVWYDKEGAIKFYDDIYSKLDQ